MNTQNRGKNLEPTIVLVHGAWEDASCWLDVIARLHAQGIRVVAAQCSLASLKHDVETVQRILSFETGPIILVGHGLGGMVITEAGTADSVTCLVYIAASAPEPGQSAADELGAAWPPEHWSLLRQDSAGFLWFPQELMPSWFAQDIPPASGALLACVQRPVHHNVFHEKISKAAWLTKPSWYLVAELDRVMPAHLQRAVAKQIGATTKSIAGGHVPFLSHASETTAFITNAVDRSVLESKAANQR